ncbi:maleylpyruvate isomerase N-terminal domain-containing protein [Rhodococcus sp. MSC1_016]|jgi:hypothetical protein|uniref:maleylpyruvate isomerase N-terminal domain-containing protein n=1 Tax=Rhodococcus sp. MSC1_016 TaxID=2909266 RepID=UPI00203072B4|nr:maleylpyruvate isomerase N-terminal domain-containing protein [Rhodococcus sp. MSC1_016]
MTTAQTTLMRQRAQLLDICADLRADQWRTMSAARPWQVRDVVAHLGATCRDAFGPRLGALVFGTAVEHANDDAVIRWRKKTPAEVVREYARWSGVFAAVYDRTASTPVGAVPLRLADLGWYPIRLLPDILVFDHHVHLHYDIAPVIGLSLPEPDEATMSSVLRWMLAGLEQMNASDMRFVDRPLRLELTGPGCGSWTISPCGDGRLRVTDDQRDAAVAIHAKAVEFPEWATTRAPWRERAVELSGDREYGERFLDHLRII